MNAKPSGVCRCLGIALGVLLVGAVAHGQPAVVDSTHYWTWSLFTTHVVPDQIMVRDQFLPTYIPIHDLRFERLLNPAWKTHAGFEWPVTDPTLHLTWYDVMPHPFVGVDVVMFDQFYPDGIPTTIDSLVFILVPARKNSSMPPPPPGQATHYLCYDVVIPGPGVAVGLRDQFEDIPTLFVEDAEYVCAPCWKMHNGIEYWPRDEETHLVFYAIHAPFSEWMPFIRDQFQEGTFIVRQDSKEYLVVPAIKEHEPVSIEDRSWGRVKGLYR